jgi:DNA-binding MarR family transcriptional regulator
MNHDTLSRNVTFDFLVSLRKVDKRGLTVRDILILYVVITTPGISGVEVTAKLGIKDRSAIASNLRRLERESYIEDRREEQRKAVPAVLHVLPKGLEFWDEIKP